MLKDAGCSQRVIVHCRTVRVVADVISKRIPEADRDLVTAGALLHDIGRSKDHTIMHAVVGAEMAEKLGLPAELVEIIRRHTGAGLDEEDIATFGLPSWDYFPRTIEQKIVAEADNLVSDSALVSHRVPAEKLRSRGAQKGADRIIALHRELSDRVGFDLDLIVEMTGERPVENQCQRLRSQEKF
ncbi:MAG: HDIG domain-containing metalloprotein [Candidatus Methanomethylophilaceae archaeon]